MELKKAFRIINIFAPFTIQRGVSWYFWDSILQSFYSMPWSWLNRTPVNPTDWTKCILCQETTAEPLQCPENTRRSDIEFGKGYRTLANNIIQFNELGNLPISIDTERLDEDSGIAPTLIEHKARWHKTCKDKFSTLKLQRIEKRKNQEETNAPQPFKFTRTSSGASTSKAEMGCFFCGGTSETLHQASTFNVDDRVRQCAFQLQDKVFIA